MRISLLNKLYGTLFIRSFMTSALNTMKAVQLKQFGGPENFYVADNILKPELSTVDHILVRVAATALNRADTLQRKGGYKPPKGESKILGLEASGIIDSVGANVTEYKVGDRVMALLGGGGYAEYVSVHKYQVMKIPDGIDLVTAAAIPEVWLTAYQLLHFVGRLSENEAVLIHAAGSGVGTAAIQLTKALLNTKVIATAGTKEKLKRAKDLGADVIINYKEEDFTEKVAEFTGGLGVNLILDPVGSSNWERNMKSISMDGRWVLYGLMGGAKIEGNILAQMLRKRAQLLATTLRNRPLMYKKDLIDAFSRSSLHKFSTKDFLPIVDSVTLLDNVVEAHTRMDSNLNTGKIIMKVADLESTKQEL